MSQDVTVNFINLRSSEQRREMVLLLLYHRQQFGISDALDRETRVRPERFRSREIPPSLHLSLSL